MRSFARSSVRSYARTRSRSRTKSLSLCFLPLTCSHFVSHLDLQYLFPTMPTLAPTEAVAVVAAVAPLVQPALIEIADEVGCESVTPILKLVEHEHEILVLVHF